MTPKTQKLVDQRNQKALKAMEELLKLPYSKEQRTNQVNQAYKAHNQINPNKQNNQIIRYTSITLTQNPGTDTEIRLIAKVIPSVEKRYQELMNQEKNPDYNKQMELLQKATRERTESMYKV